MKLQKSNLQKDSQQNHRMSGPQSQTNQTMNAHSIKYLQQTIGNQAVMQMLRQSPKPTSSNIIQKKPSQSSHPIFSGTYWDRTNTMNHNGEDVPTRVTAMMKHPSPGGVPSVDPPGWDYLRHKFGRLKGSWVRFHIINNFLGGPGDKTFNLVPTQVTLNNNSDWRTLETYIKNVSSQYWAYLDVALTYDNKYPAGIPKFIEAEGGYWDNKSKSWEAINLPVSLHQPDPKTLKAEEFYRASELTIPLLKNYGLNIDQISELSAIMNKSWKSQTELDYAILDSKSDLFDIPLRIFVDDDSGKPPYPAILYKVKQKKK